MGLLTNSDSKLFRRWFREMAKLRGISVKYQYATSTDVSIHSEFDSEYSREIPLDVIFDTNPRVNTLKRIGWVSTNPDDKPYIVYLPYNTPHLTTESIVIIPPQVDDTSINDKVAKMEKNPHYMEDRKFKVTSINQLIEYPDCWICTLAPVYDSDTVNNDYDSSNFNFIQNPDDNHDDNNDGGGFGLGMGLGLIK